ncbi:MAG TPA: NADH-quinone oxidoreductase subunit NuoI [Nitrospirae bacterium]|nr:NADH-quinone oxidoreductase subunit NuoI [Nitrospirota bacterium]
MTAKDFLKRIFLLEILKGMALTFKTMFSKAVTRQYPLEPLEAMPGFRGLHALAKDKEGNMKCIGCGLCVAICPSQCIKVFTTEGPTHEKVVERYEIDTLKCLFCAFCVEACPYGAIVLTEHYEYSDYVKENLYMDKEKLLQNWDKYMAGEKGEEYFKRFWKPLSNDFKETEGQAVFRGYERR